MVLRDLLGHSSATTTEVYTRRLDRTRLYRELHSRATPDTAEEQEADSEFTEDQVQVEHDYDLVLTSGGWV